MPCALTEPDNYPDYLKKILKEIASGDDEEAKACACKLKTPVTEDGCLITDSDGKLLAFPFCLRDTNPNLGSEPFATSDIGLSYKDAMKLYWKRDPINISFQANGLVVYPLSETCPIVTSIASTSLISDNITLKDLICGMGKGAIIASDDPSLPGFKCRTDSCSGGGSPYGMSCYYFGVEFAIFFPYYIDGTWAWIDKEAELIYPYIYGYESLNGCCGNLGPTSGTASSDNITINTSTKTPGFGGSASGTIIVSLK